MASEISCSCVKHPMTMGDHICGECGHQFCTECVVFPFGTARPPMCIACALERGGVRRQPGGPPKFTRRSIRERLAMQQRSGTPVAPVPAQSPPVQHTDDPWLDGQVDPGEVPGAWRQQY